MKRMLTGRSSGLFAALLTACCVTVAQAATAGTKSAARTAAVKPAVLTVKAQPENPLQTGDETYLRFPAKHCLLFGPDDRTLPRIP